MTTNAWGAPTGGASNSWADDVHEEEQAGTLPNPDFPTLGEAAKAPPPAKKKAKGQKLGLGQFLAAGGGPAPPPVTSRVTDADILRLLPTAPRADRDPDEANAMGGLGGGFREYGGDRGNRGFSGGFGGREERPDRRGGRDEFEPSRAESVDDWGTVKKFVPSEGSRGGFGGGGFGDRRPPGGGGGFGDRYGAERPPMRPSSNADEVDDWGSSKKFEPSAARPGPPGGFRDGPPRRAGFEGSEASRADEEDQWSRGKAFQPTEAPASRGPPAGGRGGFGFSGGAAGEEDRWSRKPLAEPSAAAAAPSNGAPAERPRLKLQPRTVDAAAGAAGSSAADAGKSKSNPFGAARPREEVLKEKGVDPTKEDAKLAPVSRDTTPEEKALMDQLEQLRKSFEILQASAPDPESIADEIASADEELQAKEKELQALKEELDEKARNAPKPEEKPDTGAFPDAAGEKRDSRGARSRGPPAAAGAREPRSKSREAAPFAGAPGKERW